jgi:beta-glucosidase-like glycosyl hydrolase
VISAAKHSPNHGFATSDSHVSLPLVRHDAKKLRTYDLPPLKAAIDAGVPMVMVGHLSVSGPIDRERPADLSEDAISTLRGDLGLDGVVVTDDLAMTGLRVVDPSPMLRSTLSERGPTFSWSRARRSSRRRPTTPS